MYRTTHDQISEATHRITADILETPEFKTRLEAAAREAVEKNFESAVNEVITSNLRQALRDFVHEKAFYDRARELAKQWLEHNIEFVKTKVDETCAAFVTEDVVFMNAARHHLSNLIGDLAEAAVTRVIRRREAKAKKAANGARK